MNFPRRDTQHELCCSIGKRRPLRDRLSASAPYTSPVRRGTMGVVLSLPGKVHRNDAQDAAHANYQARRPLRRQRNITFSDLRTLDHAMKALFVSVKMCSSLVPFQLPSADAVDQLHLLPGRKAAANANSQVGLNSSAAAWLTPSVLIRPGKAAGLRPEKNLRLRLPTGRRAHRHDEVRHQSGNRPSSSPWRYMRFLGQCA